MEKTFVRVIVLIISAFAIGAVVVAADESSITFPIPELSNCNSKQECKAYCDLPEHMDACVTFAESRKLMSKSEAETARKFRQSVTDGSSPGGCTDPNSCKKYCDDIGHIEECLAFAERHGHKTKEVEHASKIAKHIKSGGTMPGGCTTRESCEAYCGDFSHIDECATFFEKIGIEEGTRGEDFDGRDEKHEASPSPEQMRRLGELVKKGETPGDCSSRAQCEAYCQDPQHQEECLEFAEKAGFMKREDVERVRKLGGRGPGGCASPEECRTFCSNVDNEKVCFEFAREHGIFSEGELKKSTEGKELLREAFEDAPPEVRDCIKKVAGVNIDQEGAALITPGPLVGERIRACFEEHRDAVIDRKVDRFGGEGSHGEAFRVESCVKEKIEASIRGNDGSLHGGMESAMKSCMQQFGIDPSQFRGPERKDYPNVNNQGPQGIEGGSMYDENNRGGERPMMTPQGEEVEFDFSRLPAHVVPCVKERVGSDVHQKLQEGKMTADDIKKAVESCMGSSGAGMPNGSGSNGNYPVTPEEREKYEMMQQEAPGGELPREWQGFNTGDSQNGEFRPPEGFSPEQMTPEMQQKMMESTGGQFEQNYPPEGVPMQSPQSYQPRYMASPLGILLFLLGISL